MQRVSLFAAILFMASFLCSLVVPTVALAVDASWVGDDLSYNGKTFAKMPASDVTPKLNPISANTPYSYRDTTANRLEVLYVPTADIGKPVSAQYVIFNDFNPPDTYSSASVPLTIAVVAGSSTTPANTNASTGTGTSQTASGCDSSVFEGLGWVLCPVSNLLAKSVDWIYGIISNFLVVTTLTTDRTSSVFKVWQIVVTFANLCFIFAFLYVVYLHLVSVDIEKHHLFKRALPRMLVAALLVNISYWICALAVDTSNLLGYSVEKIFAGVRESVGLAVNVDWSAMTSFILSAGAVGSLVGFAAATGGSLASAGFLLISMLVSVVLAAIVAFVILAARQALIVIFIIISPLAFVAWTLPNTEKFFKKWLGTFMTLLMLFPIFSALFGGSMLAGAAIMNSANGSLIIALIGMSVQIIPLALTPLIIRFSTGLLGQIANITNNSKRGLADRTRNWAMDNSKHHKLRKLNKSDNMVGRNPLMLGNPARLARTLDQSRRRREMMDKENEEDLGKRAEEDYQRRVLRAKRGQYRRMRERRLDSHSKHERANIYKERLDSMGESHWANELQESNELKALKRQSHITSGMAKVVTNSLEKADERALQEAIDSRRDMRKLVVQTGEDEKRAQLIQQDLKNKSDAHWERISREDPTLAAKRVAVVGSEASAAREKATMDKLLTEVKAEGVNAQIVTSLSGQLDPSSYNGLLRVAQNVKSDTFETYIEDSAQRMAERSMAQERATVLKDVSNSSEAIRARAAGILRGRGGEQSVRAQARRESSKFLVDDIENIQSTLDNALATDTDWLQQQLSENQELKFSERIAYSNLLAKAGGPGTSALKRVISRFDRMTADQLATEPERAAEIIEEQQDYKDFMRNNSQFMGLGKDLEFWATNSGPRDEDTGKPIRDADGRAAIYSFDELTKSRSTWNNLSARNLTTFNVASQFRALNVLYREDREAYDAMVRQLEANDGLLMGELKKAVVAKIRSVAAGKDEWSEIPDDRPYDDPALPDVK